MKGKIYSQNSKTGHLFNEPTAKKIQQRRSKKKAGNKTRNKNRKK